jgi:hypothetical protein
MNFLVESENFLLIHRNRYLEGMDDGQKTPHGHPDFHSYVKILRVFIFQPLQPDGITDRETNTLTLRGLEEPFFQLCCCVRFLFW